MPKISIIIPVYNAEKYLEECLDSILNQTLQDIEIVCINDGSQDSSLEILKEYEQKDKRLKIIDQNNSGAAISRNNGIKIAQGEFVFFLDSDDKFPYPDTLETLYNNAIKNNVLICGGEFSDFQTGSDKLVQGFSDEFEGYTFDKNGIIEYKDWQFDFGFTRFIYNREFLLKNNIQFRNYRWYEDPPFFVEAMIKAEKFYALDKITFAYRVLHKGDSWNNAKIKGLFDGIKENLEIAKKYDYDKLKHYTCMHLKNHMNRIKVLPISFMKEYINLTHFDNYVFQYCKNNKILLKDLYIKYLISQCFFLGNVHLKDGKYKVLRLFGINIRIKKYE